MNCLGHIIIVVVFCVLVFTGPHSMLFSLVAVWFIWGCWDALKERD